MTEQQSHKNSISFDSCNDKMKTDDFFLERDTFIIWCYNPGSRNRRACSFTRRSYSTRF